MPHFVYIGLKPETIVGLEPKDISEEEYDALPWELQQAVLINKGSNGGSLYSEVREAPQDTEASDNQVTLVIPESEPTVPTESDVPSN